LFRRPGRRRVNRGAGAGERAYGKCYSCHALEPGKTLEGPSLYRIVGKRIAAEPGFAYSPALRRFARRHPRWTPELLDRFAADPEALVPKTSMNFPGMRSRGERRALIRYLQDEKHRGVPAKQ
jgi:cytochrome c